MRTWMVRHPNLTFTRPIPEPEFIQKIESGEISPQDEIAASNGYWFSLQEAEEVKLHFGDAIILQSLIPSGTDTTSSTSTAIIGGRPAHTKTLARSSKSAPTEEVEAEAVGPSTARFVFGLFLVAIFVGTLLLLWLGSR